MAKQYIEVSGKNPANVAQAAATIAAMEPGQNDVTLPEVDPVSLRVVATTTATVIDDGNGGNSFTPPPTE